MADSRLRFNTCEVKVGRLLKCRGTGPNKKTAKANAAESALEKIRNSAGLSGNSPGISQLVSPTRFLQQPSPAASVSSNTGSNPIGSLQEMCVKNNWPSPSYDQISETGKPHMKTFTCECKVGSVVAQGQGKAKKTAKKLSAENALSMITQGADPMRRKRKHEKEKQEKSKKRPLKTRLVRKRNKIAVDKNMLSKLIGMKQLAAQLDLFSKELNNLIKLIERKFRRTKRI